MRAYVFFLILILLLISPVSSLKIDPIKISIAKTGEANCNAHYELNFFENIWINDLAFISGGLESALKNEITKIIPGNNRINNLNAQTHDVSFTVEKLLLWDTTQPDAKGGYWIQYQGIAPQNALSPLEIKNMSVIFPDGYIKKYNVAKIPSELHYVNEKTAEYKFLSYYYEKQYEIHSEFVNPSNYVTMNYLFRPIVIELTNRFFEEAVVKEGLNTFFFYGLPEWIQKVNNLKTYWKIVNREGIWNTDTLIPPRSLDNMQYITEISSVFGESNRNIELYNNMKKMDILKKDEERLLDLLVSPNQYSEFDNNILMELKNNLNEQSSLLIMLKRNSDSLNTQVDNTYSYDKNADLYLQTISHSINEIIVEDITSVNEQIQYFNNF